MGSFVIRFKNLLRRLKIGHKITIISISWFLFLGLVTQISIMSFKKMHQTSELTDEEMVKLEAVNNVKMTFRVASSLGLNMLVEKEDGRVSKQRLELLSDLEKEFGFLYEKLSSKIKDQERLDKLAKVKEKFQGLVDMIHKRLVPAINRKADYDTILEIYEEFDGLTVLPLGILDSIAETLNESVRMARIDSDSAYENLKLIIALATIAAILGTVFSIILVRAVSREIINLQNSVQGISTDIIDGKLSSRADVEATGVDFQEVMKKVNTLIDSFVNPIREVMKVMQGLAEKDLSTRLHGNYRGEMNEFKDNINRAAENLMTALSKVSDAVSQVNSGGEQVSVSADVLSQNTTRQAAALQEISSSLNEVGGQARQNAENASQAQTLSGTAKGSAEKGNRQMKDMLMAMKEISKSSEDISKIIKVIDEIAFQTNLLALNAAVEAARAGKHGKGFAVVAEEVRNLAARSAKAAKETTEMIETSNNKVGQGSTIAEATAKALEEIVGGSTKVTDLVNEIAAASNEQAQSVNQIVVSLKEIDQVTQQNTANAEQSAAAAKQLSEQAEELSSLIGEFKI